MECRFSMWVPMAMAMRCEYDVILVNWECNGLRLETIEKRKKTREQ